MSIFRFLFKRLFQTIPILFVLSFLTLLLINLTPGNYFDALRLNPQISPEIISQYENQFHIKENVFIQYLYWLKGIISFDFGYSFAYQQKVADVLLSRLGNTFLLSFLSFLLSWFLAIPLGIWAALHKNSIIDRILLFFSYSLASIPGFLLAIIFVFLFANYTQIPVGGMRSYYFDSLGSFEKGLDISLHLFVPLLVLSSYSFAYIFRLMRSNFLEALQQDYVRILYTRGIPKNKVIQKHVLRNAMNPLISLFGLELPGLFSGAALIEIVTGWPGLGVMMLEAIRMQDIFLVMGNMVMIALLLIIGNLISDLLLSLNDPRVRAL